MIEQTRKIVLTDKLQLAKLKIQRVRSPDSQNEFMDYVNDQVFARPLRELAKPTNFHVPILISNIISWFRFRNYPSTHWKQILDSSPNKILLREWIDNLNTSRGELQFPANAEPSLMFALLKEFFRQLPEPVIPFQFYRQFLATNSKWLLFQQ
jgi:hypothetical protein